MTAKEKKIEVVKKLRLLAYKTTYQGERDTALEKAKRLMLAYEITEEDLLGCSNEQEPEFEEEMRRSYEETVNEYMRGDWGKNAKETRQPNRGYVGKSTFYYRGFSLNSDPRECRMRMEGTTKYYDKYPKSRPAVNSNMRTVDGSVVKDSQLKRAVNRALHRDEDTIVTSSDMKRLKKLKARGMQIYTLNGLEKAVNLKKLDISYNPVSDLSVLSELRKLIYMNIEGTEAADFRPLMYLKKLRKLRAANTPVVTTEPLYRLPLLVSLDLTGCMNLQDMIRPVNMRFKIHLRRNKYHNAFGEALAGAFYL